MHVRNTLIAAGAALASLVAMAAAPTVASAQGYEAYGPHYQPAYVQTFRPAQPSFEYGYARDGFEPHRYWEMRREEGRRHDYWEHRRAYEGYRGW